MIFDRSLRLAPVVETTGYNGTKSAFADWRAAPARCA
jgi:hypothetical protein